MSCGSEDTHRAPLPEGCIVFRLHRAPMDEERGLPPNAVPHPLLFRPTEEDEKRPPVLVSVWHDRCTTIEQAQVFRDVVCNAIYCVGVDALRVVHKAVKNFEIRPLDVVWEWLENEDRPGREGHAGILGLHAQSSRPPDLTNKQVKIAFNDLRQAISDAGTWSYIIQANSASVM